MAAVLLQLLSAGRDMGEVPSLGSTILAVTLGNTNRARRWSLGIFGDGSLGRRLVDSLLLRGHCCKFEMYSLESLASINEHD
jgi:hypothetical protein